MNLLYWIISINEFYFSSFEVIFFNQRHEYRVTDGPEGVGKSTTAGYVIRRLRSLGRNVIRTREPGGTIISERIRRDVLLRHDDQKEPKMNPMTELLLFSAARAQLVEEVIRPAIEEGTTVYSDRSWFASFAYQGYGRGIDTDLILDMSKQVMGEFYIPDRAIILDLETKEALNRNTGRNDEEGKPQGDRIEREPEEFHARTRQGYLELASILDIQIVDASRQPDEVGRAAIEALGLNV